MKELVFLLYLSQIYYTSLLSYQGQVAVQDGDFVGADAYFQQVADRQKQVFGEHSVFYAEALNRLGEFYCTVGEYELAADYMLRTKDLREQILGKRSVGYGNAVNNIGVLLNLTGDYDNAEQYFKKSLDILSQCVKKSSVDYVNTMSNLGLLYFNKGEYQIADSILLATLKIVEENGGTAHPKYAYVVKNLGDLHSETGDFAGAEAYMLSALDAFRRQLGEKSMPYIGAINSLGGLYFKKGDLQKAEQYLSEAVRLYKDVFGENHINYAFALANIAVLYVDMSYYDRAEQSLLVVEKIVRETLGEQHPFYGTILNNLGAIYTYKGDHLRAESYFEKALEAERLSLGENHPNYANALDNLGSIYYENGDYASAEKMYLEALAIRKNVYGELHPDCSTSFNNLGYLYQKEGDYRNAEKYLLKAKDADYQLLGDKHPKYAIVLNNISMVYNKQGDYDEAIKYSKQALDIQRQIYGNEHTEVSMTVNNLGLLYANKKEYAKAKKCFEESLSITEKILGKDSHLYATSLLNLATVYQNEGRIEEAEKTYLHATEIERKCYGEGRIEYASCLHNLAAAYISNRKFKEAEKVQLQANKITLDIFSPKHPFYAPMLDHLGLIYFHLKDDTKAYECYQEAGRLAKERYIESVDYMSERQRQSLWKSQEYSFGTCYTAFAFITHKKLKGITAFAYDNELFRKGLLLNSTKMVSRSIMESKDTMLINRYDKLTKLKELIVKMQETEPQSEYLKQYVGQAEQLEKQLTEQSVAFRENNNLWSISWDTVRSYLRKKQTAIEFMTAPVGENSLMYCALLLKHNSKQPLLIPLFEEKEVKPLVHPVVSGVMKTNNTYDADLSGLVLKEKIWGKILPHIKPGETVFFAPAGLLHCMSVEALPYDESHTMADMFNLIRVSSTREIITLGRTDANTNNTTSATLYGGIEYGISSEKSANRNQVGYLKGTKIETDLIGSMLEKDSLQVESFSSNDATEESFKALSGKHRNILHIATHGFFWSDSTAQSSNLFSERLVNENDESLSKATIDPLTRCGLLFAGANNSLSGETGSQNDSEEDGILTAKEISLLDLRDAELVVLSACETGKGEITGEGVFGLQRAFKQAGAETIVMSLWPVNDMATQKLMTEFYRNWITLRLEKREAFRQAQNSVREEFEEPAYWAGFVMLD